MLLGDEADAAPTHPSIGRIFDRGEADGEQFAVFEYVPEAAGPIEDEPATLIQAPPPSARRRLPPTRTLAIVAGVVLLALAGIGAAFLATAESSSTEEPTTGTLSVPAPTGTSAPSTEESEPPPTTTEPETTTQEQTTAPAPTTAPPPTTAPTGDSAAAGPATAAAAADHRPAAADHGAAADDDRGAAAADHRLGCRSGRVHLVRSRHALLGRRHEPRARQERRLLHGPLRLGGAGLTGARGERLHDVHAAGEVRRRGEPAAAGGDAVVLDDVPRERRRRRHARRRSATRAAPSSWIRSTSSTRAG